MFDLKKLKDEAVLDAFQATICGRFQLPVIIDAENTDIDSMIQTK